MNRRTAPPLHDLAEPIEIAAAAETTIVEGEALALALAEDGAPPEWVQLFPAQTAIEARDGRKWTLDDPAGVIAAFEANKADLPFDFDHAAALKAPKGEAAPATGWIKGLAMRAGALCARVDWTVLGRQALLDKTYRYVSPAFRHSPDGRITSLHSAALVTRPALHLPALAAAEPHEAPMKLPAALAAALGLAADATEDQAVAAVAELKRPPSLTHFVPRGDYDLALANATEAKSALVARETAEREARVTVFLDGAVKAGKMAPASRTHYLALCSTDAGFAEVQKIVDAAPSMFKEVATGDPNAAAGTLAITAEEHRVAIAMGLTDEQFAKGKAA